MNTPNPLMEEYKRLEKHCKDKVIPEHFPDKVKIMLLISFKAGFIAAQTTIKDINTVDRVKFMLEVTRSLADEVIDGFSEESISRN